MEPRTQEKMRIVLSVYFKFFLDITSKFQPPIFNNSYFEILYLWFANMETMKKRLLDLFIRLIVHAIRL